MKRILFLLIIGWSICSYSQNTSSNIYVNCINYIKENKVTKAFALEQLNSNSLIIEVSEEVIPFSHNSVFEDVMRKDYIKDYSMFKAHLEEEIILENRIDDSLNTLDIEYNKGYLKCSNSKLKMLSDCGEPNFVLFFSQIVNQRIYGELIPFSKSLYADTKKSSLSQGQALTFLLILDENGNVTKGYNGLVHYE